MAPSFAPAFKLSPKSFLASAYRKRRKRRCARVSRSTISSRRISESCLERGWPRALREPSGRNSPRGHTLPCCSRSPRFRTGIRTRSRSHLTPEPLASRLSPFSKKKRCFWRALPCGGKKRPCGPGDDPFRGRGPLEEPVQDHHGPAVLSARSAHLQASSATLASDRRHIQDRLIQR